MLKKFICSIFSRTVGKKFENCDEVMYGYFVPVPQNIHYIRPNSFLSKNDI